MRKLKLTVSNTQPNSEETKPTKAPRRLDLLNAIEQIVEMSSDNGLTDELFAEAKRYISYVSRRMKLTAVQAVLFSLFVDRCEDRDIRMNDISKAIKCRTVKLIRYMNDIDELERRHLITCNRSRRDALSYSVPFDVINALKLNEVYEYSVPANITADELFSHIDDLLDKRTDDNITFSALIDSMKQLFEANQHLSFVRKFQSLALSTMDSMLFLHFCNLFVQNSDDHICCHDFDDLYDRNFDFVRAKRELFNGSHDLLRFKLVEYNHSNGFVDRTSYRLSTLAKEDFLSELSISLSSGENDERLTKHSSIVEKTLYYNEREQSQVGELFDLLSQDRFNEICSRLEENGMRKGFACLFYGAPGTGKTETVLQLARKTGRDIFQVNFAQLKSCWVGESEKNVKQLFDTYRAIVNKSQVAPILLFNEADAIFGRRMEGVQRAVDKMENAIQNIILQEMETLEGIMIATTNLTSNLDNAFERRFLYKIEFEKPSLKAKTEIWKSMIPELTTSDAQTIASEFNFSGGQIENIARKRTIDCILTGKEKTDIETLRRYCQSELISKDSGTKRVGF